MSTRLELTTVQRAIAKRMRFSRSEVPDFSLRVQADMTQALAARDSGNRDWTINDLIVRTVAVALREHPKLNGAFEEDAIKLNDRVDVAFAVAAPGALYAPVIRSADTLSLEAISAESRRLAQSVREGTIQPVDLRDGTFTVSNLGMFGIDEFDAVINPPQSGILAVGRIAPQAVVIDDELSIRKLCALSLTCDHRVVYGAEAAAFLTCVQGLLEAPEELTS
ncbi:MAG TPA: dihydrolipoamide acetyltransferase family protein [Gaiellaceae bacterium]|jgi:pyruvate dehydrogenase E2 component (dihydrolipoamide acetyltransferase)|nr:dihydrolipoamide acetyltransferase family protein [Gaiellaceae bacterium]